MGSTASWWGKKLRVEKDLVHRALGQGSHSASSPLSLPGLLVSTSERSRVASHLLPKGLRKTPKKAAEQPGEW